MGQPPTIVVASCSLNTGSRSHRLAQAAVESVRAAGGDAELIDLREWDLPVCDGRESFDHASVKPLTSKLAAASGILVSAPVYNYDLNAAAKNLVEMTGSAWKEKPVGFLCSAGGSRSYMAPIGFANSLMLDFRCLIIPRFVYCTGEDFDGDGSPDAPLKERVDRLAGLAVGLARALNQVRAAGEPPRVTPGRPA